MRNKKNIGILTFHEIHNPGAFWQAFATVQLLKSMGHNPVIINYTSPPHRYHFFRSLCSPVSVRHPRYFFETAGKVRAYRKAQAELPQTVWMETHADVSKEYFDAVVIGSDIVWDFKTPRLGKDPIYFGHYLNAGRLIAYAPSCGSCRADEEIPTYVINGLKKFSAIAVRDANTQGMVRQALGREVPIIGDPTFNLKFDGLETDPDESASYIVVYAMKEYVSEEFKNAVITFARSRSLQIIAVGYRIPWVDRNVPYANPFEWLGWLRHATYVVTNTFHGTLFSLFLKKQFVTELNPAIGLKTALLLSELTLDACIFQGNVRLEEVLGRIWNTREISGLISRKAEGSRSFLSTALQSAGKDD